MNIIAIIPARMAATRFPGKPLAMIHGVPMVGHVALRTRRAPSVSATYVATCDASIEAYCQSAGIDVIMTGDHHERCSTRVAEALFTAELRRREKADIVLMVQGDEPMVTPEMIELSLEPFRWNSNVQVVNLMGDIQSPEEWEDPNCIKVVTDIRDEALFFSRAPLPRVHKFGVAPVNFVDVRPRKQVCVIPFRREALLRFHSLPATPLEAIESIDMLRFLEYGDKVLMVHTPERSHSVDTPDDLRLVSEFMEHDAIRFLYEDAPLVRQISPNSDPPYGA